MNRGKHGMKRCVLRCFLKRCNRGVISNVERKKVPERWCIMAKGVLENIRELYS